MIRPFHAAARGFVFTALLPLLTAPVQAQVNAFIGIDNERLQGAGDEGEVLLFTPDPVQPGSSVSHWDTSASPNLLMEPFINPDLTFLDLDLSVPLMEDLGWPRGFSTFSVTPLDEEGVGFTDPTPFPGAPGNDAETLGAARINLMATVLGTWASTLASPGEVDVLITWTPLPCDPFNGAVLAAAGPIFAFSDHPSFPRPQTWYPSALAEALAGENLSGPADPGTFTGDIIVFVNSAIDQECLGAGTGYYYGLDGNAPENEIDLITTLLHELAHGLGFSSFADETTGAFFQGLPGIYDTLIRDTGSDRTWDELTDAERVDSAVSFRKVTWAGAAVTTAAADLLTPGVPELAVTEPASVAGSYVVGTASFGPPIDAMGLTGELACALDDESPFFDSCSPITSDVSGKIALIDRGTCLFAEKTAAAQAAGAIAAVIVNVQGESAVALGGQDDPAITIPSVSVGRSDGLLLRSAACTGVGVATTAATTPTSRSVQIGDTWATAFATIINIGEARATGCAISPITQVDAEFFYQTTDPATNVPVGSPDIPANIDPGAMQTYVFGFKPRTPFQPTLVELGFECDGAEPSPVIIGLNTLRLAASEDPVADIIALTATPSGDGTMRIPGVGETGFFAVATANVGAGAMVTFSADAENAGSAVSLTVCASDPANGQCLEPPAPEVTVQVDAGATPTFSVFGAALAEIPFEPATTRVFVRLEDAGGTLRGEASVAVTTQ